MRIDNLEYLDNLDKKLCRNRLRDNVIPESSEVWLVASVTLSVTLLPESGTPPDWAELDGVATL